MGNENMTRSEKNLPIPASLTLADLRMRPLADWFKLAAFELEAVGTTPRL